MARTLTNVRSAVSIPDITPDVVQQQEVTSIAEAEVFAGAQKKEAGALIQKEAEVLGGRIDAFETGKAKIELGEMANEIAARVEQTPEHGKWDGLYKTEMRKAADAVSKKISSGDARVQFGIEAGGLMTRGSARMRGLAKTREKQVRHAEVLTYAEKSLKAALKTDNTEDIGYYIRSTHAMIDEAVKRFSLSPLVAFNMKQKFVEDLATGKALSRDPAQFIRDVDEIRKTVNGKVVWKEGPTGTYLDFIPRPLMETLYRQKKAGTAGQTALGNANSIVDKMYENNPDIGRKAGAAILRNPKTYEHLPQDERALVRGKAEVQHAKRQQAEANENGVTSAIEISNRDNKDGSPMTMAQAIKEATKIDRDSQPAAVAQLKIIYAARIEEGIKSHTAAILAQVKNGDLKTREEAVEATGLLNEDIRPGVKKNVEDAFDEQTAIRKRDIEQRQLRQVETFYMVRDMMAAEKMTAFEVWKKDPRLHAQLTPAQRRSLEDGVRTNYGRFDEISLMSAEDLGKLNLAVEINNLAGEEFALVRGWKTAAVRSGSKFTGTITPIQVINAVVASHGLGGKKHEKDRGRLKSMYMAEVAKQEGDKKRKLTFNELNEIAGQMTSDVQKPGSWWGTNTVKAYKVKILPEERRQIIEAYKQIGNNKPTEQQIVNAHTRREAAK